MLKVPRSERVLNVETLNGCEEEVTCVAEVNTGWQRLRGRKIMQANLVQHNMYIHMFIHMYMYMYIYMNVYIQRCTCRQMHTR